MRTLAALIAFAIPMLALSQPVPEPIHIAPDVPVVIPPAPAERERPLPLVRRSDRNVGAETVVDGTRGTIIFDGSGGYSTYGVWIRSEPAYPHAGVELGAATSSASFRVFAPASPPAPLFTVLGDGRVGIGVEPTWRLSVTSPIDASGAIYALSQTTVEATASQADWGAFLLGYQDVAAGQTNESWVGGARAVGYATGAGTVSRTFGLMAESGLLSTGTGVVTTAYGSRIRVLKGGGAITSGYALYMDDVQATNGYGVYQIGADDRNYFAGSIGVGKIPAMALDVVGNANFTGTVTGGNIKAKYQDVAEWVPATTDLSPGMVVILNPAKNNEVMASNGAYDTTVAGVVSAQPGLSLGEEGEGKEQIATTGRVKVRVDARVAAIRIGDLLVTSDIPGTAMRSEPMEINGRRFHQPGTILGKALEPLESGVGEILVLLSMQ